MPEVGVGTVAIKPDASGFGKALSHDVDPALDKTSKGIGGSLGGAFKSVAAIGGGLMAAAGVKQFLGDVVSEAREAAKVGALTENTIKQTGGAAKISAEQVGELSTKLSNMAGIDDELIQTGANLLLTFKNVRNEVGEGAQVFDRATAGAVDLSAAGFGSVESASVMLGKALNDPIKGISALGRAGVTFSAEQKEQIKTMQLAGDTLGAQKIILQELESQVGGSAAAMADPWDRFGVVVGNLKERIGTALLPVLSKAMDWLADKLPGALQWLSDKFTLVKDAVTGVLDILLRGDFTGGIFGLEEDHPVIGFFFKLRDIGLAVGTWITTTLIPTVQRIVEAVGGWGNALKIVGVVVALLMSPITVLIGGLILAYTKFEGFRTVVDAVVQFLLTTVWPLIQQFAGFVIEQFASLVGFVQQHWAAIQEAISHVINVVEGIIRTAIDIISALWRAWGDDLLRMVIAAWDFIKLTIENVINVIKGIINLVLAVINGDWGKAWEAIKGILKAVWDQIRGIVQLAIDLVKGIIAGVLSTIGVLWEGGWNLIKDFLAGVWERIKTAVSTAISAVVTFVTELPGKVVAALSSFGQKLWDVATAAWERFDSAVDTAVEGIISFIKELPGDIVEAIGDLGATLLQKGKDLIAGFISGIVEGAKGIAGAITKAIGDAIPGGGFISGLLGRGGEQVGRAAGSAREPDIPGHSPGGGNIGRGFRAAEAHFNKSGLPGVITSRQAGRTSGAHAAGRAIDISVPGHGNRGYGSAGLRAIFEYFKPSLGSISQMILAGAPLLGGKNPPGAWKKPGVPGNHWNHVHVATYHGGGRVLASSPTIPGLAGDERPAILQVGETVLAKGSGGEFHWHQEAPIFGVDDLETAIARALAHRDRQLLQMARAS